MASRQSYWLLKRVVRANVTAKFQVAMLHVPSGVAPTAGVGVSKKQRHTAQASFVGEKALAPRTLDTSCGLDLAFVFAQRTDGRVRVCGSSFAFAMGLAYLSTVSSAAYWS